MDMKMKRYILAVVAMLLLAGGSTWVVQNLRIKREYDEMRESLGTPYEVRLMDDAMTSFLAEVETNWEEDRSFVGGPIPEGLELVGMEPTVAGLAEAYGHSMPPYSFTDSRPNKQAVVTSVFQGTLLLMSVDRAIYVSAEGDKALVRVTRNKVSIFTDTPDGLQESCYYLRDRDIEQSAGNVPANAGRTAVAFGEEI